MWKRTFKKIDLYGLLCSANFMMLKFCKNAQFQAAWKCAETKRFHKISTPGNFVKNWYFTKLFVNLFGKWREATVEICKNMTKFDIRKDYFRSTFWVISYIRNLSWIVGIVSNSFLICWFFRKLMFEINPLVFPLLLKH